MGFNNLILASPDSILMLSSKVEIFVGPSNESVLAFSSWLSDFNLTSTPITPSGDWVSVDLDVGKANDILGTEFHTYIHEETDTTSIRTLEYSIPASLQDHITSVHPTVL